MRSVLRLLPLTLAAALAACGGDDEPRPPRPTAPALPVSAHTATDTIPFERLYGVPAVENLRVTPVEIHILGLPRSWDSLRVAVLSDFQLGLWPDNEKIATAALRRALELQPHLVLLLGDFLARGDSTDVISRVFAPLRGRPAFAVLGDRDLRDDTLALRVTTALRGVGVTVLRNERAPFTYRDSTRFIAGIDADLFGEPAADVRYILTRLAAGRATPLLLSHLPAAALAIPSDSIGAVLAGNTFCGQIEVPGTPRLSWLNQNLLQGVQTPGVERLYRVRGATLFVTCGLGYSFVPVRYGAPPEIALITLRRVAAPPPPAAELMVPDSLIQRFERQPGDTARDTAAAG